MSETWQADPYETHILASFSKFGKPLDGYTRFKQAIHEPSWYPKDARWCEMSFFNLANLWHMGAALHAWEHVPEAPLDTALIVQSGYARFFFLTSLVSALDTLMFTLLLLSKRDGAFHQRFRDATIASLPKHGFRKDYGDAFEQCLGQRVYDEIKLYRDAEVHNIVVLQRMRTAAQDIRMFDLQKLLSSGWRHKSYPAFNSQEYDKHYRALQSVYSRAPLFGLGKIPEEFFQKKGQRCQLKEYLERTCDLCNRFWELAIWDYENVLKRDLEESGYPDTIQEACKSSSISEHTQSQGKGSGIIVE